MTSFPHNCYTTFIVYTSRYCHSLSHEFLASATFMSILLLLLLLVPLLPSCHPPLPPFFVSLWSVLHGFSCVLNMITLLWSLIQVIMVTGYIMCKYAKHTTFPIRSLWCIINIHYWWALFGANTIFSDSTCNIHVCLY